MIDPLSLESTSAQVLWPHSRAPLFPVHPISNSLAASPYALPALTVSLRASKYAAAAPNDVEGSCQYQGKKHGV